MAVANVQAFKVCSGCKEMRPIEFFSRDRRSPDGLDRRCRQCKRESMRIWRNKSRAEQQKQKIAMAITQEQIDSLKQKYMLGMDVEIRQGDKKLYGRITGHYEHFMTVQTTNYPTSILYKDILIGAVQVK